MDKDFLRSMQQGKSVAAIKHLIFRLFIQVTLSVTLLYCIKMGYVFPAILNFLFLGFIFSFMGWAGAGHEYFHSTAFKSTRVNRFFFRMFSCATWNNWGWFEISHWLHHKYTLHSSDPEGSKVTPLKKHNVLWLILVDFPTFFRRLRIYVLNVFGIFPINDLRTKELLFSKPSALKRIRLGAFTVILFQILQFLLFSLFSIQFAISMLLAPFAFTFPNRIVEICQHLGMKVHANDFRQNTRTLKLNKFLEFLYANMNYHTEHHMFPGIPYYNLPQVHSELLKHNLAPVVDYGLMNATRIAFRNEVINSQIETSCLSCSISCPTKPIELKDD